MSHYDKFQIKSFKIDPSVSRAEGLIQTRHVRHINNLLARLKLFFTKQFPFNSPFVVILVNTL